MRAFAARTLALALLVAIASDARGAASGSRLAPALVTPGDRPELVLAQRVIDREWGPENDSTAAATRIPGWRSEGLAMALSAAAPGAGQLYAGEGSGLWFALAEVAGWTAHVVFRRQADDLRAEAASYAGAPGDTASAWSFGRWQSATQAGPAELARLYAVDREAFYELIGTDARYLAGWRGDAATTRESFQDLRGRSDSDLERAHWVGTGLWINHLVAAVDALRAARFHNLPLRRDVELKLRSSWRRNGPQFVAIVERRF